MQWTKYTHTHAHAHTHTHTHTHTHAHTHNSSSIDIPCPSSDTRQVSDQSQLKSSWDEVASLTPDFPGLGGRWVPGLVGLRSCPTHSHSLSLSLTHTHYPPVVPSPHTPGAGTLQSTAMRSVVDSDVLPIATHFPAFSIAPVSWRVVPNKMVLCPVPTAMRKFPCMSYLRPVR